ncbi:sporulation protein YjcZ [Cohnella herbarum]|uniref:Sporulation protein YjcZ n=1 Tax=Cohnella herbarum TaxID=2728023 RepID=A0A7Z2ZM67_9BACL|nr:sporulation protein YjcZ [Cohnella herbarum]QJD84545.1 sporulation protein YjcZ [Cohnella herbarum]
MGYPVAGAGYDGCAKPYGGGVQAAAFVLVLFILLVIILKAGYC